MSSSYCEHVDLRIEEIRALVNGRFPSASAKPRGGTSEPDPTREVCQGDMLLWSQGFTDLSYGELKALIAGSNRTGPARSVPVHRVPAHWMRGAALAATLSALSITACVTSLGLHRASSPYESSSATAPQGVGAASTFVEAVPSAEKEALISTATDSEEDPVRASGAEPSPTSGSESAPSSVAAELGVATSEQPDPSLESPWPRESAPGDHRFASWVRQGGWDWPWDLALEGETGRRWNLVTGRRGRRRGGHYHNAIDIGAPRGTPIRFVGYVPWERARVIEAVPNDVACASSSHRRICNAGSIIALRSVIGRLRITRRIYHSHLAVDRHQELRPGDHIGLVWDYGRTQRKDGRRGRASHVHYEVWVASVHQPPKELGENVPLSRLRWMVRSEVQRLELAALTEGEGHDPAPQRLSALHTEKTLSGGSG